MSESKILIFDEPDDFLAFMKEIQEDYNKKNDGDDVWVKNEF